MALVYAVCWFFYFGEERQRHANGIINYDDGEECGRGQWRQRFRNKLFVVCVYVCLCISVSLYLCVIVVALWLLLVVAGIIVVLIAKWTKFAYYLLKVTLSTTLIQ